ncbi:NCS2 family permease [Clostridium cylindrosporum]|uniref:Putative permease n=1 Tax=Clostridium cylindrosporum DSM 605 TaxID=1121307 RepID=A0A0J8DGI4_CLOCY|nr:NCS2 family permease [Clostridium cylindrosporum]KMT23278.1 putative permease [Clostridium cylindrosporum DSM 605]
MSQENVRSKNSESLFEKIFKLKENKTDIKTEVLAGITTFLTMAYILFVNPNILKMAGMNSAGVLGEGAAKITTADPVVASVFMATCVAAAAGSILLGLLANLPFAVASGMGLNAFFTFTVVMGMKHTWQEALAAVFISGVVFFSICVTPLLNILVKALPKNIKLAITGGIGLFIALVGLKSGGIIVDNPDTLVGFGNVTNPAVLLTIIGIIVTAILLALNVKASMLIGIIVTTLIGIPMGITHKITNIFQMPPSMSPTFLKMDFAGLLFGGDKGILATILSIVLVVITITLVDLFDSVGTLIGTASRAGLVNEDGTVKNVNKAMMAASFGVVIGASCGTSTMTTYVESTAGIAQGGRTGLTSVTVGVLFIAAMFLTGIVGIVPAQATAPALVIVGVLMLSAVSEIDFSDFTESVPVFFIIAMMPFTYSIANGISIGLIMYPIMKIFTGRWKEVHPIVYVLAVLFIIRYLALPH